MVGAITYWTVKGRDALGQTVNIEIDKAISGASLEQEVSHMKNGMEEAAKLSGSWPVAWGDPF